MLLAVDTSTRRIGLALYDGTQVLGEMTWKTFNYHTVELAPALKNLFKCCGVTANDLEVLAVALGPGSFTSLRIGLSVVKGMALGLHISVIGIQTLDILAYSQPLREMPMAAVLRAGRGRLAVGWYRPVSGEWQAMGDVKVMTIEELKDQITETTLVCGELSAEERNKLRRKSKLVVLASPAKSLRRPSHLAELAWRRWEKEMVDEANSLSPIYLHIVGAIPA